MSRITIVRKDGTPSPYFWTEEDRAEKTAKTVYKQTETGVKKMTGVHFNAITNRIEKH